MGYLKYTKGLHTSGNKHAKVPLSSGMGYIPQVLKGYMLHTFQMAPSWKESYSEFKTSVRTASGRQEGGRVPLSSGRGYLQY
jgi:hypothetical protein